MENIKDELVSFDTAKLAKEKGFDLVVHNYYKKGAKGRKRVRRCSKSCNYNDTSILHYSRPTQALLQRWLREVHNINIHVQHWNCMWMFSHQHIKTCHNGISHDNFKTYELALEAGLNEALKTLN